MEKELKSSMGVVLSADTERAQPSKPFLRLCPVRRSALKRTPVQDLGGFQLLDLIIAELKSHMTCYNSRPLIC